MKNKGDSKRVSEHVHFVLAVEKADERERAIRYPRIETDVRHLAGKILTNVDAAVADKVQREALKDNMRACIRDFLFMYWDMCYLGKKKPSNPPEL